MSAEIDWDTYEPTAAVRKASMVLFSADTVDATCFGWVPQAREALATALDVEVMSEVLDLHGGEAFLVTGGGQITECPTCGEVPTDLASHLAAVLRTALLGADS